MTSDTTATSTLSLGRLLPAGLRGLVESTVEQAVREGWAERLWARDASLWTADEQTAAAISGRLGWLDVPAVFAERVEELEAFATGVVEEGFEAALVCGMGGSSLAPEVLARSFPRGDTGIPVRVLDSTDPAAVRAASTLSDPLRTLYVIASKSGTTTETLAFLAHFWELEHELHSAIPAGAAGRHFVAITDPGRSLEAIPHADLFREAFLNPADVGGRYSALTYVGLVPAALMGLDLRGLLASGVAMAGACHSAAADNPGLWLGAALGALAGAGRDKLTLVIEPRYASFGAWAEQLIAESTGKQGRGIVPVNGEPLMAPEGYGPDRLFVRLSTGADAEWQASSDAALAALAAAGQPVIDLRIADGADLGGEFFRWQFATAICGAVLGVNPFDEPNVTESKDNTRRVLEQLEASGVLPRLETVARDDRLAVAADAPLRLTAEHDSVSDALRGHLARARSDGYIGLHAYVAPTPERTAALEGICQLIGERSGRPVTLGYGPRFLHSTGQLHKGGPPSGCFIQLVADHAEELAIPGRRETFGQLIHAQAAGDFVALESHELPIIRVELGASVDAGLAA
ncbi:MAG TPA: transaldolase, partial [Candidatus Limnocylindria bacterium]|nr:transaldolase [Candidatus Limnocylindria bacterium]